MSNVHVYEPVYLSNGELSHWVGKYLFDDKLSFDSEIKQVVNLFTNLLSSVYCTVLQEVFDCLKKVRLLQPYSYLLSLF